jgi:uncharacterized protein
VSLLEQVIVAVVTKLPEAGKVKTRLMTVLSAEDAAGVHRVLVTHVLDRLKNFLPPPIAIKVVYDPPEKINAMRALLPEHAAADFLPQCTGDLGERLAAAAEMIRAKSPGHILFFGVDSPDLPDQHVIDAADKLVHHDVVVGPTDDGGYWCLGISPRVDARRLLCDIPWSSGTEHVHTVARARSLGYRVVEGFAWEDVDHPPDLRRLIARLRASKEVRDQQLLSRLTFLPKEVLS